MDNGLRNLLGLLDDGKRIYRFSEDEEVTQEEFEYCKVIDQVVFGEKGLVATLGPTWQMIHDPRFLKIEKCFIIERPSIFGGDTTLGRQYIDDHGNYTSDVADLEQYSEILGEGRHFRQIILEKYNNPEEVKRVKDWEDEEVWKLLREQCPNYFYKPKAGELFGGPNREAKTLFKLLKADLLGLVDDYAEVPYVNDWRRLNDGELVPEDQLTDKVTEEGVDRTEQVTIEVDTLEQALTYRASLRITAVKVLADKQLRKLFETCRMDFTKMDLTDIERDEVLRIIYQSEWPSGKMDMFMRLNQYIAKVLNSGKTVKEREAEQLATASTEAKAFIAKIKSGEIQQISRHTEELAEDPGGECATDPMTLVAAEIMNDGVKMQLFLWKAEAEKREFFQVVKLLEPIFEAPGYKVDEAEYNRLVGEMEKLNFFETPDVTVMEGTNMLPAEEKA